MGSAALYPLARRGHRVLGLERFNIPHTFGSSYGVTRIIRLSYFEHSSYVPLLLRAYELWRELEQDTGHRLLHITGSIDAGLPESRVFEGSRRSCEMHSLQHEILTSAELTQRFMGYRLPERIMAVLQPQGGFLVPELCISAHVMLAQTYGAEIHAREHVLDWEPVTRGIRVRTDRGVYEAAQLVISAGAGWGSSCLSYDRLPYRGGKCSGGCSRSDRNGSGPTRFPSSTSKRRKGTTTGSPSSECQGLSLDDSIIWRSQHIPIS